MSKQQELIIKQVLDAWNGQLNRATKFFRTHTKEQLEMEVAPHKNSGVYLLGHLIAVHDALFPLLCLGERLFPELENIFLNNPDKAGLKKPGVEYLKKCWEEVHEKLNKSLNEFTSDDWLQKHNAISEEDFKKEPHRNKLNVVIVRTNHIAYHLGQLAFIDN